MKHLILGSLFLLLASGATAQTETDWRALQTMSGSEVIAVDGATEIDVSTAQTLHDRGLRFIDVRGAWYWKTGHIPGASDLKYPTEASLMEIVNKTDEVVFYCDCAGYAGCNRSTDASAKAVSWGYENVYYLTDASAWSAAGYPTEKAE